MSNNNQLLLSIARCPNISHCLDPGIASHPCQEIILSQDVAEIVDFQIPEAWSGQLSQAPLLFLSSNPSIGHDEVYPTGKWLDTEILDFFDNRFKGKWIQDGRRSLRKGGSYGRATMFWSAVRQRAIELFERDVIPGQDYALTEVVRCKSLREIGVPAAVQECASRYLEPTLLASAARVIVVLGRKAQEMLQMLWGLPSNQGPLVPVEIGGRPRLIANLPHPNAHEPRTFAGKFDIEQLNAIRRFLIDSKPTNLFKNRKILQTRTP
jgi:hypothetical protein